MREIIIILIIKNDMNIDNNDDKKYEIKYITSNN